MDAKINRLKLDEGWDFTQYFTKYLLSKTLITMGKEVTLQ